MIRAVLALAFVMAVVTRADARCYSSLPHVLGYSHCYTFANWADPHAWTRDFEATSERLPTSLLGPMASRGLAFAYGGEIRVDLALSEHVYFSLLWRMQTIAEQSPMLASGTEMDVGIAIGARWPLGAVTVGAELVPLGHPISFWPDSSALPYVSLEPRAKADFWLSRHVTLSASAGIDVFHPGVITCALGIGIHGVPYDGTR